MKIETPRIWLPGTAQTTSFATGDDGDLQAGNPRATRFVAMAAENLTADRHTGLTWVTDPRLIIPGGPVGSVYEVQAARGNWATSTAYVVADLVAQGGSFYVCLVAHTSGVFADDLAADKWVETAWTGSAANLTTFATPAWADAVANCLALDYAGYQDWRLPNVAELLSLVDWETQAWPFFAVNAYAWSSTTVLNANTYAWRVWGGSSAPLAKTLKTDTASYAACPVRGGRING